MARLILRALLSGSVDYAGLFPPAKLPLEEALSNYREYRQGPYAWMLGRFVVSEKNLAGVPPDLDGALAVLTEHDCPRASVIESKSVVAASLPVYCEVPVDQLERVSEAGKFAKVRAGGETPDAVPSAEALAQFIAACARLRLPFKATAGLHHAIRAHAQAMHAHAQGIEAGEMHGFINLFVASVFAWRGASADTVRRVLNETDASAFRWDEESLCWRDQRLSVEDVVAARAHFIHSFGSCSFVEPIEDLQQLQWL